GDGRQRGVREAVLGPPAQGEPARHGAADRGTGCADTGPTAEPATRVKPSQQTDGRIDEVRPLRFPGRRHPGLDPRPGGLMPTTAADPALDTYLDESVDRRR